MKDKNPLGGGASSQSKSLKLIVPEVPAQKQEQRSPHQLNFLFEREPSISPAAITLRIEPVPAHLTVNADERFNIVHYESDLSVPGQFSQEEAEEILQTTANWNWTVDPKTRVPACNRYLLSLLEQVCKPKKSAEVSS